ncbi:MAG: LytTR family DNA-binding domain-containing protein [Actinomycetota bacterium]|nr:LytTR family DNA-binding domain-containing protein [Actinomycetota bacterium]
MQASGADATARGSARLSVLAVDDEAPSLDELSYLLERSVLVGRVALAPSATDALRRLRDEEFDVVLLDIRMPGLDGMELARVLARFAAPPAVVFVTAHEDHALEAFEVGAAGYLLKPVDAARLDRVLRRTLPEGALPGDARAGDGSRPHAPHAPSEPSRPDDPGAPDVVAVDAGNRTLLVAVADIAWVESAGDYVRLHVRQGSSHLLRTSMAVLEEEWAERGFVRIHRSYLVSLRAIEELWSDGAHSAVRVLGETLPVSRRHVRELRDRLVRLVRTPGR